MTPETPSDPPPEAPLQWDAAVAVSEGTLMDPAAFVRLREWGGDELLGKMVDLFLKNAPVRMQEIQAGLDEGDAPRAERGAHSLKSSSGNLGAQRLHGLCQMVEDAAEEGRLDDARALHPLLSSAFTLTLRALELSRAPVAVEETD